MRHTDNNPAVWGTCLMQMGFIRKSIERSGVKYIISCFIVLTGFFAGAAAFSLLGADEASAAVRSVAAGLENTDGTAAFLYSCAALLRPLAVIYIAGLFPAGIPLAAFTAGAAAFSSGHAAAMYFSCSFGGKIFTLTGFLLMQALSLGTYTVFAAVSWGSAMLAFRGRRVPRSRSEKLRDIRIYSAKALAAVVPLMLSSLLKAVFLVWMQNILP